MEPKIETQRSSPEKTDPNLELITKARQGDINIIDELDNINNTTAHQQIALAFIEAGLGHVVTKNLDKFKGLEHQDIANRLINSGQGNDLAKFLYKFKGLDHQDIADKLIQKGQVNAITGNLDNFQALNKETALKIIKTDHSLYILLLVRGLYVFKGLNIQIALMLANKGYTDAVVNNIEIFDLSQSDEQDLANLAKALNINKTHFDEGAKLSRFDRIHQLLLLTKNDQHATYYPLSQEQTNTTLQDLVNQENWLSAKSLLDCIALVDGIETTIDAKQKNQILTQAMLEQKRRDKRENQRESYHTVQMSQELAKFYINMMLKHSISQFKHQLLLPVAEGGRISKTTTQNLEQLTGRELPNKGQVMLNDLEQTILVDTEKTFDWVKQYIVLAIQSELEHENKVQSWLPRTTLAYRSESQKNTDEEIRQYLAEAVKKFKHTDWPHQYGGKSWAKIAEIAGQMWQPESKISEADKTILLDRLFQMEHNTGMVFDKDAQRVKIDKSRERILLNKKFQAQSIDMLLAEVDKLIENQAFKKQLFARVKIWKQIEKMPLRQKLGGD